MDKRTDLLNGIADTLFKYQKLLESGAITQEEFDVIKARIIEAEFSQEDSRQTDATDSTAADGASSQGDPERRAGDAATATEEARAAEAEASQEDSRQTDATDSTAADGASSQGDPERRAGDAATATEEQEELRQSTDAIEVSFSWAGGKLLPRVRDGEKTILYDSFIKPKDESTEDFCRRIADIIQNDFGRPVRYTVPKGGKPKQRKAISADKRKSLIIAAVIVAFVAVGLLLFSNRSELGNIAGTTTSKAAQATSNMQVKCSIEYEGKSVPLTKVHVHETEHDYEYKSYIALDFDLRNLSDRDKHFFEDDVMPHVEAKKDASSIGFYAPYETKVTHGGHCYLVCEYPVLSTGRDSIVGQLLDIEIEKRYGDTILGKTTCVVDSLDSDNEFLQLVRPLGYYGFNSHGYLMI